LKKGETWAQWKYRTDPTYRKKRLKLNREYQAKLKKEHKKKKGNRDPKKLKVYRDRYERKHRRRYKKTHITKVKVFCPKHPRERLRKMHYVMNLKKETGIRTTNWHYCRKCGKPYQLELVLDYKVVGE